MHHFLNIRPRIPIQLAGLVASLACAGCFSTAVVDNCDYIDTRLRGIMLSRDASDADLLCAISRLGRVKEPSAFWTSIANDKSYPTFHRSRAVFALFRRHGERAVDLRSLGQILAPAEWLKESTIEKVNGVFGRLPLNFTPGDSVFEVSVFFGAKVYLKVQGDHELGEFNAALMAQDNALALKILECTYADDYQQWFLGMQGE